ncbi:class I SAM-dependent methyltransferase [Streptomyces sp. NPDC051555]|uniref:class I SAM-dependent methyltransferase n=1 Tax=Streptomyces sp. NPDC051555 TaxID=3365657 RepID=UPI0037917B85
MTPPPRTEPTIVSYYADAYEEADRLHATATGRLELQRTRELLTARLPPAAVVLDVGGGPGVHARWLIEAGHSVHLVDPVPRHLEQAAAYAGCTTELGDARHLTAAAGTYDAVLLLGPLYHLTERADRITALREALRVARPGAMVAAAGISRYSLMQEYTVHAQLSPELLYGEVTSVLGDGGYDGSRGFTIAHFHTVAELLAEATAAGWQNARLHGIEGPGWAYLSAAERYAGAEHAADLLPSALDTARLADVHGAAFADASAHMLITATT